MQEQHVFLGVLSKCSLLLLPSQVFKRHNPSTAEEQEMMENLFDALCSCLMLPANRDRFLRGEGLQLMNLMLRWGCSSGTSSKATWMSKWSIFSNQRIVCLRLLACSLLSCLFWHITTFSLHPNQWKRERLVVGRLMHYMAHELWCLHVHPCAWYQLTYS